MKNAFKFPMSSSERVLGCVFIPVHVALPLFIILALGAAGLSFSEVHLMLIWYTLSFIFILIITLGFLRRSFSNLLDGFMRAIQSVILGYAFYYVMTLAVSFTITHFFEVQADPNTAAILELIRKNRAVMTAVLVVLAPIVEETMFRGALFGSIRQKNRVLAYVISALLFAAYHLWQFAVTDFTPALLLLAPQYIAASIALAWSYERGGTIWTPILLHAAINFIWMQVS